MKYSKISEVITIGVLLCAPMWVAAQTVKSFTIVNADTGADIATFASTGTINIKNTPNINLRANSSGAKSVVFTDATAATRIENTAPYAYKGNSSTTYFKWAPTVGTYVIKAKPFSRSNGSGTAGPLTTLTLNIISGPVQTAPSGSWSQVAVEGANFTVAESVRIRYGSNNSWIEKTVSGLVRCTNSFFGLDPLRKVIKACRIFKSNPQTETQVFNLSYQAAPADNPLKGFLPYEGSYAKNYPHSMEWFYIPLKDIQTGYDSFDWTKLEAHLDAIQSRGHQAAFRVYLDYPQAEYGVPAFLAHVPKYSYTEYGNKTSFSPDYTHPDLRRAILNFVKAFGQQYDKDPRIGYITAGLLGFWGEWHTYLPNGPTVPSVPKDLKLDLVKAYDASFPNKMILARGPLGQNGEMDKYTRMGFHDDSFAFSTIGTTEWHFWPIMLRAGLSDFWKTRPMGGEVDPRIQRCMWDNSCIMQENQSYSESVATTHATWMINHGAFVSGFTEIKLKRIIEAAQFMGYTFHIPRASVNSPNVGQALSGSVTIENRGVAPFYYPWTVEIAALDSTGKLYTWPQLLDLRKMLPGTKTVYNFNIANPGLSAGNYTLMIGVPNPMLLGKPLKFGNTTQDKNKSGWLTLGSFTVK